VYCIIIYLFSEAKGSSEFHIPQHIVGSGTQNKTVLSTSNQTTAEEYDKQE
jgi:hypothetical protein